MFTSNLSVFRIFRTQMALLHNKMPATLILSPIKTFYELPSTLNDKFWHFSIYINKVLVWWALTNFWCTHSHFVLETGTSQGCVYNDALRGTTLPLAKGDQKSLVSLQALSSPLHVTLTQTRVMQMKLKLHFCVTRSKPFCCCCFSSSSLHVTGQFSSLILIRHELCWLLIYLAAH